MMNFAILGPQEKKNFSISWLEVNTTIGNFIIQRGHVPTLLIVRPEQPITICLDNGKQETFKSTGGILEVTRNTALLLLNE